MKRNPLAVIISVAAGILLISIMEYLSGKKYLPEGFDSNNQAALIEFIKTAPDAMFWFLIMGYALGSFLGGFIASAISAKQKIKNALTTGSVLMGLGAINLFIIPHPVWVIITSLLVYIPSAIIAGFIAKALFAKKDKQK